MGFGLSKTNMGGCGPANKRPARAFSRTREPPLCRDLDPPQQRGAFDWPTEMGDGLQNTLDAKGSELSRAQRYVLFIVLYIVFTVKENTIGCDELMSSLFKVATKTERLGRTHSKVGR